jgi:ADP-ribose pyrophosphatase YjhB (NUDIX family)
MAPPPGSDPPDNTPPYLFYELASGPERRENFLRELTDAAAGEGITQLAVGVVISFVSQVLLLRCHGDDSLNGLWELPAGEVEPGEALVEAVTRVVKAETSLNVVRVRSYIGCHDFGSESGQRVRRYHFVTQIAIREQIILARHSAYAWARSDRKQPVRATDQAVLDEFVAGLMRR